MRNKPRLFHAVLNLLLGQCKYRVRFTYKSKAGKEIFYWEDIIGVSDPFFIGQKRALKKAVGPVWSIPSVDKSWLCNGNFYVNPMAYLGRWKEDV